jgi:hypothetical protein
MLVTVGVFWCLAAFVFVVTQWVGPALISTTPPPASGFNYGQSFGLPFIKTWGWWVAGGLVVLGPVAAIWKAVEQGGEAVMAKALGTSRSRDRR